MPLFDAAAENLRKENLKKLEDKRLRFAQEMDKKGFRPERMLLCADEEGAFTALARAGEQLAVISAPRFASDDDFELFMLDVATLEVEREEIFVKGTGLNGAFGFGIKGASGFKLHFTVAEDRKIMMEVVSGRSAATEIVKYSKNPLLKTTRRRGDANIVWDFMPLDAGKERRVRDAVDNYYLAK